MICPKCGVHISPFDLKPNCKNCGVNILLYSQEYLLERDAKLTELEFASARLVLAKVKAAFIGGALPIIRIVTTLLCVAALLVPFADLGISMPLFSKDISLSGLGIYNMFSDGTFMALPDFAGSTLFGSTVKPVFILLGFIAVLALAEVAILLAEILSFINIKKSAKAMSILSVIGIVSCAAFAVAAFIVKRTAIPEYMSFKVGFGALVTAAMLAANFIVNHKIFKNDLPLKVRENDLLRKETLKKVKSGEIDLDDLTLPVFESEEEKAERMKELEEIIKEEEER